MYIRPEGASTVLIRLIVASRDRVEEKLNFSSNPAQPAGVRDTRPRRLCNRPNRVARPYRHLSLCRSSGVGLEPTYPNTVWALCHASQYYHCGLLPAMSLVVDWCKAQCIAMNQPAWAVGPSRGSHVLNRFPGLKPLSCLVVMGERHSVSKLPPVTVLSF